MFDIGFAELVIIAVVSLLVIGPEKLPSTVRTASLWLARIRRGFNEIKQEVQQELHNDSVMQELRETGQKIKQDTQAIEREFKDSADSLTSAVSDPTADSTPQNDSKDDKAQ